MQLLKIKSFLPYQKKIFKKVIIALAVFTITGFFIAPPVIKSILVKKMSERLHREVSIQKINVNPFLPSMTVRGFMMKDRGSSDTFLSFDELYINLQMASIFKKGLILKEVRVDKPYINIIRNEDTSYNFSDLLTDNKTTPKPAEEPKPLRFSISNIQILNGSVDFLDGPKHTRHKARGITVKIPTLSNFPYFIDTFVQPTFEAKFNDNPVSLKGRTKPFSDSLETSLDIDIKGVDIPYYLAYAPFEMNFKLLSGTLDAKNSIAYTQYKDRQPTLSLTGDLVLNNIEAVDVKGNPLILLPSINISIASSELISRNIHLSKVLLQSPEIHVVRAKDRKLNMQRLISEKRSEVPVERKEEDASSIVIEADEIGVSDGTVIFSDLSLEKNFETSLEKINFEAQNFSTVKDRKAVVSLAFELGNKGAVSTSGSLGINPLSADLTLNVKEIDIVPFQNYFTDKVKILVTGGSISADGALSFSSQEEGGINAAYKGKASLTKFSSVDKVNANDFLKWRSLHLNGIEIGYSPLYANINEVSLADFYSRLIINPDGSLNVQGIIKSEKADPESTASDKGKGEVVAQEKGSTVTNVKIKTVTLQAGTINFSDKHIKPNYTANFLEIGGRISGLSSQDESTADVDLKGKFENYAPLEITGKINPLREDLYVDLKVDFKDMDLSSLTPYSGKYMGYTIQKGKLSLDLKYMILKKKLDAGNNVFLDQFTLGDSVESPDATKLPVSLAIALLKDRNGKINLDLPVSGYIDDPEFHLGKIILKIIINILVKAATSPFALLGAIFGGGEELSYVEFDYGISAINEQGAAKLNTLIKALYERPSLNLDIEGYVDIDKDKEGLRQYLFNKKLKAQKLKELIKKGMEAVPVDEVTIEPDEYEKYMEKAYSDEKFPKPRNIIGIPKKLPVSEMEKLMLTHIEVKDDDLRSLSLQRAMKVQDYMLKSGQIEPKRIFLIEPKTLQPEKKEKLKDSRVDFKLK